MKRYSMYREMNPYSRLLQSSIKGQIESIKDSVYAYRGMGPGDLGYGYSDHIEYIFITGASDIERGIPTFTMPIVDMKARKPTIIVDMRPYALAKLTSIERKLEDMMTKKGNYTLPLRAALLLGDSINGGNMVRSIWYKTFSFIAVNAISNELDLDPYDRTALHITILAYMVDIADRDRDVKAKDFIIANNMLLNGLKVDTTDVREITSNLQRSNLDLSVLMENINKCSEDRRLTSLNLDTVLGSLNKLVFSTNTHYITNGFEFPELFVPLLYSYTTNTFMKRTKLAESFKYISRKIDTKELERDMKNII